MGEKKYVPNPGVYYPAIVYGFCYTKFQQLKCISIYFKDDLTQVTAYLSFSPELASLIVENTII